MSVCNSLVAVSYPASVKVVTATEFNAREPFRHSSVERKFQNLIRFTNYNDLYFRQNTGQADQPVGKSQLLSYSFAFLLPG